MATTPIELQKKIIEALKGSSGTSPVEVSALTRKIKADAAEVDTAIESLCAELVLARRVAHSFEDSVVSVWLIGSPPPAVVVPCPVVAPEAQRAKDAVEKRIYRNGVQEKTYSHIAQSTLPPTQLEIAEALNLPPESIKDALKRLVKSNLITYYRSADEYRKPYRYHTTKACQEAQPAVANNPGSDALASTSLSPAEGVAVMEKPPGESGLPTPPSADDDQPQPLTFSLSSTGQLTIIDDDLLMVIPPDDVRRLGYFLGCFESTSWPPRLDPVPLFDGGARQ